ncbi:putative lipoprotein [Streptomyces fumigatiscleroticus]|nr:putative lipoprotein [Streptomyces fumigatiscleroticus]
MKASVSASVRRRVRRRATGAGLAALLLAGGVAGCGTGKSQSPSMTPAAAVARAAGNTEDIASFRYLMTGRIPGQGRVEAEARMRTKPAIAMSMQITAPDLGTDGSAEIRLVDEVLYIGGEAAAKELDGKSWIRFDLSALGAKGLGGELAAAGQADKNPAQDTTLLTGSEDVKKVGTETVDGVRTTHYRGTVTLDDFRDSLEGEDAATRERREKSLEQYEELGADELTMDMWVDGDDRAKRLRVRGDADRGPLDMKITFLDVNKPVTITAPPAGKTVDLAEMMSELGA